MRVNLRRAGERGLRVWGGVPSVGASSLAESSEESSSLLLVESDSSTYTSNTLTHEEGPDQWG